MRLTEVITQLIFRALSKVSIRIILYNNQKYYTNYRNKDHKH